MDLKVSKWVGTGKFKHQDIIDDFTAIETFETNAEANEATRVSNETTRVNNETIRVDFHNKSIVCESYDAFKTYYPFNKATYLGSTYMNKVQCKGVLPVVADNWLLISSKGSDGAGVMLENLYTVKSDNVTNIPIGISDFNPLNDKLFVYDNYGSLLEKDINYSINVNNTSIDLLGYSANTNDTFKFVLSKNSDVSALVTRNEVGTVEELETINKKVVPAINELNSYMNENAKFTFGFFQHLLSTATKIKLIGDSITEGVGALGHTVPTTNPIIFNNPNTSETYHEGDYSCRCWANYFREYVAAHYPNITSFVNAGIGGKSTRWAMADNNYKFWVNDNEDLVFVQLGMNDRSLGDFETNITNFLAYVKAHCNNMIVMIPNPTLNDNPSLNVEVRTINDTVIRVCQKYGYFYISHYLDMLNYCQNSGTPLERLVQTDGGSHPVDEGYLFMWNNIQNKLKFTDKQANFSASTKTTYLPLNFKTSNNVVVDFPLGTSYLQVAGTNTSGFPESYAGVLITYRATEDVAYGYQEYRVYGSGRKYIRYWSNGWTNWKMIGYIDLAMNFAKSTVTIDNFPSGISYCIMTSDVANGTPDDTSGLIVTYNVNSTKQYNYQEFFQYGSNQKFIRNAQSDGSWGAWKGTTTKTTTVSGTFPQITSMGVNGQIATIPAVDTSKYAYIVSPKSVLDTSLFFSYTVSGTALYLRLFNTGATAITPGTLEFDLTVVRK